MANFHFRQLALFGLVDMDKGYEAHDPGSRREWSKISVVWISYGVQPCFGVSILGTTFVLRLLRVFDQRLAWGIY